MKTKGLVCTAKRTSAIEQQLGWAQEWETDAQVQSDDCFDGFRRPHLVGHRVVAYSQVE